MKIPDGFKAATAYDIVHWLASNPSDTVRTTIKVARELLLRDTLASKGTMRKIESKHIGAGVYEISLRKPEPTKGGEA